MEREGNQRGVGTYAAVPRIWLGKMGRRGKGTRDGILCRGQGVLYMLIHVSASDVSGPIFKSVKDEKWWLRKVV